VATLALTAHLRRIDPLLLEAARLLAPPGPRRWLRVDLPLLGPGLGAAFGVVFGLTQAELETMLLVVPPGSATVSMRIYSHLHYGSGSAVAGLCLAEALVVALACGLAARALARPGAAR